MNLCPIYLNSSYVLQMGKQALTGTLARRQGWNLNPSLQHFNSGLHKCMMSSQLSRDFPGGAVDTNSSANAGDTSSIPGAGRFHMRWRATACTLEPESQLQKPVHLEPTVRSSSCTSKNSSPCWLQLEKARR